MTLLEERRDELVANIEEITTDLEIARKKERASALAQLHLQREKLRQTLYNVRVQLAADAPPMTADEALDHLIEQLRQMPPHYRARVLQADYSTLRVVGGD